MLSFNQAELDAQLSVEVMEDAMPSQYQIKAHCVQLSTAGHWTDQSRMMACFDGRRAPYCTDRLVAVAAQRARGAHVPIEINSILS